MSTENRMMRIEVPKAAPNTESASDDDGSQFTAGSLVVTEFWKLPAPKLRFGRAEATLLRHFNAQSRVFTLGLQIAYTDQNDCEVSQMIDQGELDSLETALAFIAHNREAMLAGAKTYTQLRYESRGGLAVGLYFGNGEVGEYMVVSGQTAHLASLVSLQSLVAQAKQKAASLSNKQW